MKSSWLKYLGFLGLLGLLGIFTSNSGFYGFFGFFGWFAFAKIINDERLAENINKACRNAFVVSLVITTSAFAYGVSTRNVEALALGLIINFVALILVFSVSLQIFDKA